MSELFECHQERLRGALDACASRGYWSPFVESPSRRYHPEGAHEAGRAWFEAQLGQPFPLHEPDGAARVGEERSPYTGEALGVTYPSVSVDAAFARAEAALPRWRDAGPQVRVGLCLELLDRLARDAFGLAYATMHTTGQSFVMAFSGSGANSLDRGLEALAYAHRAMADVPSRARFERAFGHGPPVHIDKRYRLIPRGVAVVITCGSYPAWNALPAIFANLATGNPVIVKPHPASVLPMARTVQLGRQVLEEQGFDPSLLTLAADTRAQPLAKVLAQHPRAAIVDFTGSQAFGQWLEEHCRHADVYTETSGVNAVVLDSAPDLDAVLEALASSLCLFSSQMCTSPQNIYLPSAGVGDGGARVSPEEVVARLVAHVDRLTSEPKQAAALCGAICEPSVVRSMQQLQSAASRQGRVVRASGAYAHPEFPKARTATPALIALRDADDALAQREHFGPMALLLTVADREEALARAADGARRYGSISAYAYTADEGFAAAIEDAYAEAGASVGINLVRQRPLNYAAAYSDYHVTGLNPAGNACLTDLAFVARRFRIVQSKTERPAPAPNEGGDPSQ